MPAVPWMIICNGFVVVGWVEWDIIISKALRCVGEKQLGEAGVGKGCSSGWFDERFKSRNAMAEFCKFKGICVWHQLCWVSKSR